MGRKKSEVREYSFGIEGILMEIGHERNKEIDEINKLLSKV